MQPTSPSSLASATPSTPAVPKTPNKPTKPGAAFVLLLAALSMLGPFAMDTYLPSLKEVETVFQASHASVQQTLAAYLLGMAIMSLWHGAISDAVGRRPVVLTALLVYTVGALGCVLAQSVGQLIAARLVQGLAGGAGMIVARAIVRDVYDGPEHAALAQRLMSSIAMIFSIAPAIAPIVGGQLHVAFGWRSVFVFLLVFGVALLVWAWLALPETLAPAKRQSLAPRALAASYWEVFQNRDFQLLAASASFAFSGIFVYIMASPTIILEHLKLTETDFAVLFIPTIGGTMIGAFLSGRLAGKLTQPRQIWCAHAAMSAASVVNLLFHLTLAFNPGAVSRLWLVVGTVSPAFFFGLGVSLAAPVLQMLVLDLFPAKRGLVSSFQGFTQVAVSMLTAGVVAPLVAKSPLLLAGTMAAYGAVGLLFWILYLFFRRPRV